MEEVDELLNLAVRATKQSGDQALRSRAVAAWDDVQAVKKYVEPVQPTEGAAVNLKVADAWTTVSASKPPAEKKRYLRQAQEWYSKALPEATGADKREAEARLKQLETQLKD
jgi:hypothetical protein